MTVKRTAAIMILLIAAAILGAPAAAGPIRIGDSEERRIGRRIADSLIEAYGVAENPEWEQRIKALFDPLTAVARRDHLEWSVQVLDIPDVNAVAIPGGFIFVTRGMMEFARTDRELQAVLAHEMVHIDRRHGITMYRKNIENLLYSMLIVVGSRDMDLLPALALVNEGLLAGYGRQAEIEADTFGAEYLIEADSDPVGMLALFDRMAREEMKRPNLFEGYFTVHPPTRERIRAVEEVLARHGISGRRDFTPEIPLEVQARRACQGAMLIGIVVIEERPVITLAPSDDDPVSGVVRAEVVRKRIAALSETGLQAYEVKARRHGGRWAVDIRGETVVYVTPEDEAYNGLSAEELAGKWRDELARILWRAYILERV